MKNKPMATRIKRKPSPEFIFGMNPDIPTGARLVQPEPIMYGENHVVDHAAWLSDVDQFNKMFSEV